ncbi:hypothetical protein VIBRN418_15463 [Vibrio sp. N418]|uniref:AraC family transcriptional regulator n=1 Tax=Vibrio sp. (strain N418) TaxID=701176 RepID=UPI00021BDF1E|nr:helix-turn-helix domain-containing protein [Vibrio sp. N418]EGU34482.1 hypothetical protein VIBRN418_15463 [Vibrio sp. N418]
MTYNKNKDVNFLFNQKSTIKTENFRLINHQLVTYVDGARGEFHFDNSNPIYSGKFIILISNSKKCITFENGTRKTLCNDNQLILVKDSFKAQINEKTQFIFIEKSFYVNIGMPKFHDLLETHIHERLVRILLEALLSSPSPFYEIMAIANIIGVDNYKNNLNCTFSKLIGIIESNASNEEFNLNSLCEKAYMSRRKVQYILSNNNTNFVELVNNYRVEVLKNLLLSYPKTPVNNLIYKAGFKNYNTAVRVFKTKFRIGIREFKSKQFSEHCHSKLDIHTIKLSLGKKKIRIPDLFNKNNYA